MCNRYEQRGSVSQIRALAKSLSRPLATVPATDNLGPLSNIYPDQDAPIVINKKGGGLELTLARWGFPPLPDENSPIINIRNLKSKWWRDVNRQWLTSSEYRCLVAFTAFAEPVRNSTWFEVKGVEVAYFAGFWRPWRGERLAEQPGQKRRAREMRDWNLFAFLTTEANDIVRPVHPKAMPVILSDPAEQRAWLDADVDSLLLQRPLGNELLEIREST